MLGVMEGLEVGNSPARWGRSREEAETMRVSVGTPKGELVVQLQGAGTAPFLPASHECLHYIGDLLAGHRGQRHRMAIDIDEMHPIEALSPVR